MAIILHLLSARRLAVIKALTLLCYANGTVLLWGAGVVIPSALLGPAWLAISLGLAGAVYLWAAVSSILPGPRWRAWLLGLLGLLLGQLVNDGLLWLATRWLWVAPV